MEEAHRGVRKWVWSRLGRVAWVLIGEGGSLADGVISVIMGYVGGDALQNNNVSTSEDLPLQPSNSTESLSHNPRHSVKEALSSSSSFGQIEESDTFDPTDEFVGDFVSMLQQGLFVFANVDMTNEATGNDATAKAEYRTRTQQHAFEGGFKLGIFSFSKDDGGQFLISPMAAGVQEINPEDSAPVTLPLDNLKPLRLTGAQGLILECNNITKDDKGSNMRNIRAEIVLSDESDRNILLNGLNACLPHLIKQE